MCQRPPPSKPATRPCSRTSVPLPQSGRSRTWRHRSPPNPRPSGSAGGKRRELGAGSAGFGQSSFRCDIGRRPCGVGPWEHAHPSHYVWVLRECVGRDRLRRHGGASAVSQGHSDRRHHHRRRRPGVCGRSPEPGRRAGDSDLDVRVRSGDAVRDTRSRSRRVHCGERTGVSKWSTRARASSSAINWASGPSPPLSSCCCLSPSYPSSRPLVRAQPAQGVRRSHPGSAHPDLPPGRLRPRWSRARLAYGQGVHPVHNPALRPVHHLRAASISPATLSPPRATTSPTWRVGAVLANLIGTMGASMVLIRPVHQGQLRAQVRATHRSSSSSSRSATAADCSPLWATRPSSWASCAESPSPGPSICGRSGY